MAVCKGDAVRLAASSPSGCAPLVQQQIVQQNRELSSSKSAKFSPAEDAAEVDEEIEVDLREVYFLIMHFLSSGPCHRATGQLWNELLQHKLLPRRYHGLHSRTGMPSADENDDGSSFPLSYVQVTERYKNVDKNHLIKLLQQLLVHDKSASLLDASIPRPLTAADVPTLLGSDEFSLLESEQRSCPKVSLKGFEQLRWPHWQADQVHAVAFRELGGGFAKHRRAPSIRTANHVIVKPSVLVDRIRITKVLRGHRNAVYCAVFDRTGRYLVTGSDDRLVKIWSADSGLCLRSCRGHEGDITDLSVSNSNTLVASASNDSCIRIWRLPDGVPVSILRGHTAGVTAIEFSPRQGCEHHLLSSSEDGTCRIWDARDASVKSRVYMPKPDEATGITAENQILCCAFNADGSFFATGSSDKLARVWDARRWADEFTGRPNYELDILSGHENVVNYVQFSGCAEPIKMSPFDTFKEDSVPRFKNTWFAQDSIVTCSRDGSAIIWSPRPRKQVKLGRWAKAYHLKVPPPPMPQPPTRTGGPRQRLLPTPRGVNMIVWSLDNRFVLAAIMDCRICVWNAVDGSLVHCLTGHSKQTYVLDVHPYDPRIAMSAGYDGRVIIWDIWEGRPVRTYETADFNLVDGNFSPDGMSLVVSDEVGQVYLFSTGLPSSQEDAKYDQFFLGDYRPLVRDTHGNVLDQETQLPPHQRNLQDLLCDASMLPYPEPYQSFYQQRRLGALGANWRPPSIQLAVGTLDDPAYIHFELPVPFEPLVQPTEQGNGQGNRWVEQPADVDPMDWDEEVTGLSDDSGSDYCASEESQSDEEGNAESGSMYDTDSESEAEELDYDDGVSTRRSRSNNRHKRKEELETSERQVKRRRLEESDNAAPESSSRRKFKSGKRTRIGKSDALRPMRVAARNALNMFSSLHDDDEEEGATAQQASAERPATSAENRRLLRSGKAVKEAEELDEGEASKSVVDTADMGECRRPRSQRRLVLKLKNCSSSDLPPQTATQAIESSDFTENETQVEADEIAPGESGGVSDEAKSFEGMNGKRRHMWKKKMAAKRSRLLYQTSSEGSAEQKVAIAVPAASDDIASQEANASGSPSHSSPPHSTLKFKLKLKDRLQNGVLKLEDELIDHASRGLSEDEQNDQPPSRGVSDDEQNDQPPSGGASEDEQNDQPPSRGVSEDEQIDQAPSRGVSEADKSLSADYFEEQGKEQESLQNGGEDDPDYHEEVSPVSNSEEAYRPEREDASDELDDEASKRKRNKAVYTRRKRKPAVKYLDIDDEAEPSNNRRRSTRLAQGRPVTVSSRMSTRNKGKARKSFNDESSYEDSDWERSRSSDGHGRRSSSRLKGKLGMNVGSRYRDFHARRDRNTVHRNPSHVSWLLLTEVERTRYIPQFGDQVVYFRQGHQDYIENKGLADDGPWRTLRGDLRAVEFCEVTELEYVIAPETGNTCCDLTLEFVEGYRKRRGRHFCVTLPELTDIADFIVEKSRYEASISRNWSYRDKCQVWWRSVDDEGGSWWEGRVTQVKAKSPEFPESPWDSISVQYKDEPQQPTQHSPWELHDIGNPSTWEQPSIDADEVHDLLETVDEVLNSNQSKDEFGLWRLQQAVSKPDFLDRIPLPMSMDVIRTRLEKNYYRSMEAVGHDFKILIENFKSYFGKDHSSVLKVQRLKERFSDVLKDVSL